MTAREREVALLVAIFQTAKLRAVGIKLGTVKIHVHKIVKKGGVEFSARPTVERFQGRTAPHVARRYRVEASAPGADAGFSRVEQTKRP